MISTSVLRSIAIAIWTIPIVGMVLYWIARLLAALGDQAGSAIVDRVLLVFATFWGIAIVLSVAISSLRAFDETTPFEDAFPASGNKREKECSEDELEDQSEEIDSL